MKVQVQQEVLKELTLEDEKQSKFKKDAIEFLYSGYINDTDW